jgi:hypothetical protein
MFFISDKQSFIFQTRGTRGTSHCVELKIENAKLRIPSGREY